MLLLLICLFNKMYVNPQIIVLFLLTKGIQLTYIQKVNQIINCGFWKHNI